MPKKTSCSCPLPSVRYDLQPLAPAPVELVHAGVGDLGDDRDVLVQRQVGEAGELAPLRVPPRVVVQQVADRVQAEMLGHHLRGVAAEDLLQGFVERGHAIHCTPRRRQLRGIDRAVRLLTRRR